MYRFLGLLVFFLSCSPSSSSVEELDLLAHGVPIKVKAPAGSTVIVEDLGIIKDVTITDSLKYNVQLFASNATTLNATALINDQKKIVEEASFFSKIVEESDHGFIYEKKIDEENLRYDFRYVKIQGDKQYIFQTALSGGHEEQDVRKMYESVQ